MMPFVVIVFVIWTIFNEGAYLTFKTILRKKQPLLGNESKVSCSKTQLEPLIGFETMIAVRRTDHCATPPLQDMYETPVCPTSEHFPQPLVHSQCLSIIYAILSARTRSQLGSFVTGF